MIKQKACTTTLGVSAIRMIQYSKKVLCMIRIIIGNKEYIHVFSFMHFTSLLEFVHVYS